MARMAAVSTLSKIGFVVTCLALGPTQSAYAAPIDLGNDIEIDWSLQDAFCGTPQALSTCPTKSQVTILGAPRLVPAGVSGDQVFIEVSHVEENVSGIFIGFDVFYDDGTPVDLSFGGPQLRLGLFDVPLLLLQDSDGDGDEEFEFKLGDFANFDGALNPGIPLIFSVYTQIKGQGDAKGEPLATITVSGVGSVVPVPEPSTLLLLGSGIAALVRRQTFRRARS